MLGRVRKRGGQAAVLIALCVFSLVIFVAFATNMGILVNDKIRIQNAADMGAYSAAYREAQVLNKLTTINQRILGIARECRETLEKRIWQGTPCACVAISPDADEYIDTCESRIRAEAESFFFCCGLFRVGGECAFCRSSYDEPERSGVGCLERDAFLRDVIGLTHLARKRCDQQSKHHHQFPSGGISVRLLCAASLSLFGWLLLRAAGASNCAVAGRYLLLQAQHKPGYLGDDRGVGNHAFVLFGHRLQSGWK